MRTLFPAFVATLAMLAAPFAIKPASAVNLNPRGLGQVLIFPYYTVNAGQDTLISIGNYGNTGKAMLVRVHEGYNARIVLDFGLLLSAHDVWTASISQLSEDGAAAIRTSDRSCTYPALGSTPRSFLSSNYTGQGIPPYGEPDSGPQTDARTREGYIEVIALYDTIPGSEIDQAITHVQNGTPGGGVPSCDSDVINFASMDEAAPTATLAGAGSIVNVGLGTFFGYAADAIDGFTDAVLFTADGPFLGVSLGIANSADSARVARARVAVGGRSLDLDYDLGIDAVSAVYMADAIYNEYIVDPSLGAGTDWVVTMPTRNYYTDPALVPSDVGGAQDPRPPFNELFLDGRADTELAATVYDREEGIVATIAGPCSGLCPPVSSGNVSLPYAVNVIGFGSAAGSDIGPSGVLGSHLVSFVVPPASSDGYVDIDLTGTSGTQQLPAGFDSSGNEAKLVGLPVTGFMVYNIVNASAQPGLLANYSGAFAHRMTTSCLGDVDDCRAR